jgi:hypothetical protein
MAASMATISANNGVKFCLDSLELSDKPSVDRFATVGVEGQNSPTRRGDTGADRRRVF